MRGGANASAVWVAANLLGAAFAGLCFSSNAPSHPELFPITHVLADNNATIPCPHLATSSSANFSLLKDGSKVASGTIRQNGTSAALTTRAAGMAFQVHAGNESHFMLLPEMVDRTGLYTCKIEDRSPPAEASGPERHMIILETCPSECTHESPLVVFWPWAVGCGLLAIYSVAIIKVTLKIRHKLKECDSNDNDYMNIKPRGFRGHARVQQPAGMTK